MDEKMNMLGGGGYIAAKNSSIPAQNWVYTRKNVQKPAKSVGDKLVHKNFKTSAKIFNFAHNKNSKINSNLFF